MRAVRLPNPKSITISDWEFGQLSEDDSREYTKMLVALQRRLDGDSTAASAVRGWARQPPVVSVFANGFGNRSTCTQFRDGWNSCSEVHPASPNNAWLVLREFGSGESKDSCWGRRQR